MSKFHAVVWMDHQEAHVLQFDPESVEAARVKARSHHPRHHGPDAKALAEFYNHVAQALAGVHEVLVVGPGAAHDEFHAHCSKHVPAVAKAIVASQKADHPTDAQLVALARQYFSKYDRMAGTPTPM
jgi:stalled ribosome rescue protein Dom34